MKTIKKQLKQIKKDLDTAKTSENAIESLLDPEQINSLEAKSRLTIKQATVPEEVDFKNAVGKVKPIVLDTIHAQQKSIKKKTRFSNAKQLENQKHLAEFHFSDEYEPLLPNQGAMKYVREDVSSFESKSLRRGDYVPELILDLHGLNQQQTKREISALIQASHKQHVNCVCIVHGIGSKILKNKVPHWLVQHPRVMAFHQATLEWGGNGALLVLLEVEDR